MRSISNIVRILISNKNNMYNEYAFQSKIIEDNELHNLLFDAFYSDLCIVGVEGIKQLRKKKESKIQTLERCISHYEKLEKYERCAVVKNILDQIK
jgi:hypothetical protein